MDTPRNLNRLAALLASLTMLLTLPSWSPTIGDPNSGLHVTGAQISALSNDTAPTTIGPVLDVIDAQTGRTLYSQHALQHHAIGSITKLMTALLSVRRLKLNRVVTVSAKAGSTPGSTMWLVAGDRLPVRSLLYGLLIPSGNDAAEELAETMAGTDHGFARIANRQARHFRLKCSHYVTPHGLDAKGQYSCAADVATLTRLLLKNHLLARIVSTQRITVLGASSNEKFPLINTNLLLGTFPGIIGVKTGTTDQAGASLSAADRRHRHVIIAVILGSTDYGRFSDAASLITFAYHDFIWPGPVDTMWSTASLIHHQAVTPAPIPRWEAAWVSVGKRGIVTVPFDSHK